MPASGCRTGRFVIPNARAPSKTTAMIALDVRELIRRHVFDQPAGSAFRLNLAYPWLRVMRLNSSSLDLQLVTGRTVIVPLVWASCGVVGERMRLECPLCGRRVCALYYLEPRARLSALQWPLVCGTAHQQHRAKVSDEAKNPPEARRLWPESRAPGSRRSRAACGGGPTRGIVLRWPGSNASWAIDLNRPPPNRCQLMVRLCRTSPAAIESDRARS